jgi:hypothetical protein
MEGKNYLKLIVFVILTLVAFIGALTTAFFSGAGMYYAQGVFEVKVLEDQYKYTCNGTVLSNGSCSTGTFNTDELDSYANYQTYRDDINNDVANYMGGYTIVFSLLTLVFLFLALREAGIFQRKGSSKQDMY